MWIKICGNTNLEDARLAMDAGADALGFVFAPSPRRVSMGQAKRIIDELPPEIEKYGVFVDADFAGIVATVEACGLTGVQLHRYPEQDLPSRLLENYAGTTKTLKILHVLKLAAKDRTENPEASAQSVDRTHLRHSLVQLSGNAAVHAVLVDSSNGASMGGTGSSFDWAAAQPTFLEAIEAAPQLRLIVAGGLRPENVKEAISTLRPWGVDVVSGVEAAPGKKDPARLAAFIQIARDAAAALLAAK